MNIRVIEEERTTFMKWQPCLSHTPCLLCTHIGQIVWYQYMTVFDLQNYQFQKAQPNAPLHHGMWFWKLILHEKVEFSRGLRTVYNVHRQRGRWDSFERMDSGKGKGINFIITAVAIIIIVVIGFWVLITWQSILYA